MTLFEIKAPDGRLLRQEHQSLGELKPALAIGYEVTGVVFGAAEDGSGGLVERIGSPSLLRILLDAHGDDLLAWLKERGVQTLDVTRYDAHGNKVPERG